MIIEKERETDLLSWAAHFPLGSTIPTYRRTSLRAAASALSLAKCSSNSGSRAMNSSAVAIVWGVGNEGKRCALC